MALRSWLCLEAGPLWMSFRGALRCDPNGSTQGAGPYRGQRDTQTQSGGRGKPRSEGSLLVPGALSGHRLLAAKFVLMCCGCLGAPSEAGEGITEGKAGGAPWSGSTLAGDLVGFPVRGWCVRVKGVRKTV